MAQLESGYLVRDISREEKKPPVECKHMPEGGFLFTICDNCGATAMYQRTCGKCGLRYCSKCGVTK